jgi:hypothetical protein
MAHTTEDAKFVWQKVKAAVDTLGLNKEIQDTVKAARDYASQVLGNPNLKFTPIDAATNGSDGGNADTVISDTANTALLLIVLKKRAGSVAAFDSISNHASAIQAAKVFIAGELTASKQFAAFYPKGFKNATGMTYASVTVYNGTTHSLTADSCDGFAVSIDAERL